MFRYLVQPLCFVLRYTMVLIIYEPTSSLIGDSQCAMPNQI